MSIYTSILTGGTNNHQTTSAEANALATDILSEGIIGATTNTSGVAPMTGGFAVNAQGTPAMAVDVSAGVSYVSVTPTGQTSQTVRVYSDATQTVSISSNATGSTKYDWIYISVSASNAANPNTAGDDVSTLVVSRSTSASSDDGTPPTYAYPIAVVTVANGASTITNGNITDKRVSGVVTSLADLAITTAKLAAKAATLAKIDGGSTDGVLVTASGNVAAVASSDFSATWSTWSPNITGFSSNPANGVYRYRKIGKDVTLQIRQPSNGTSNSASFTISLPSGLNAATITNMEWHAPCQVTNGSTQTTPGLMYINSGGTAVEVYLNYAAAGFATTGNKRMGYGQITYEAA